MTYITQEIKYGREGRKKVQGRKEKEKGTNPDSLSWTYAAAQGGFCREKLTKHRVDASVELYKRQQVNRKEDQRLPPSQ